MEHVSGPVKRVMEELEKKPVRLVLPLPDSVNAWPRSKMALHHVKMRYQLEAWVAACSQCRPTHEPPSFVAMNATFYIRNKRDEDNLKGSLKWVCDALKQAQVRDEYGRVKWRAGVADEKGYFVDDDPKHLTIAEPAQHVDRKNPRLEIELTEAA
jgi:hypothetical protein